MSRTQKYRKDGISRKVTTMNLSVSLVKRAKMVNPSMSALVERLLEYAIKNPGKFRPEGSRSTKP